MNIYYLTQRSVTGYETYDECIVVAENEQKAKTMHPNGIDIVGFSDHRKYNDWPNDVTKITCEKLGPYTGSNRQQFVVMSSYNQG